MTRIVIVRHGNTFEAGETPRRIGARTDLPLTADGQAQADALGRWFAAQRAVDDAGEVEPARSLPTSLPSRPRNSPTGSTRSTMAPTREWRRTR
jgi:broad specificity phosphatase PhoE